MKPTQSPSPYGGEGGGGPHIRVAHAFLTHGHFEPWRTRIFYIFKTLYMHNSASVVYPSLSSSKTANEYDPVNFLLMWIVCKIFNSIFHFYLFYLLINEKKIKQKQNKNQRTEVLKCGSLIFKITFMFLKLIKNFKI